MLDCQDRPFYDGARLILKESTIGLTQTVIVTVNHNGEVDPGEYFHWCLKIVGEVVLATEKMVCSFYHCLNNAKNCVF